MRRTRNPVHGSPVTRVRIPPFPPDESAHSVHCGAFTVQQDRRMFHLPLRQAAVMGVNGSDASLCSDRNLEQVAGCFVGMPVSQCRDTAVLGFIQHEIP
jgi:hypothetical protein